MKRSASRDINMLEGPILSSVIRFMIPLMLAGILQCFYNAADFIIVGRFSASGQNAQAAVGATSAIINLVVNCVIGIATGANIILARALGSRDAPRATRVVHTSFVFSALLGIVLFGIGQLTTVSLLRLTDCPADVIDGAELYMRIYYLGTPASFIYNYMAAVIRTKGDSKRPLYYLAISGLVNVALNLVFVAGFHIDVAGVAIATIVSQYLSAIFVVVRLARLPAEDPCRLRLSLMRIHSKELKQIVRFGLPSAVSSSMYAISNIQIQSAINAFGPHATAANSASGSIEGFVSSVTGGMSAAAAAFIGQNIGAENPERVRRIAKRLYIFGVLLMLFIEIPVLIFGKPLLGFYLEAPEAIDFGIYRLRFIVGAMVISAVMNVNGGTLQAFGYTMFSMINSIVGVCGFRVLWMAAVYPRFKTPFMLYLCYPISWGLVAIVGAAMVLRLVRQYRKGRSFRI